MTKTSTRNAKTQTSFSMMGDIDEERIDRIWKPFWINYPEGTRALRHLEWILKQPKSHRTQSSLITAEPAAGKTAIAMQFTKMANPPHKIGDDDKHIPVVYVQSPPDGKAAGLYTAILKKIGVLYQTTWHVARKQDQVLLMLTKFRTRMLIIDELHTMLSGNINERSVYMSVLKHLSTELQIPIVGIGTKEALRAIQTDEQFASRFEPYRIDKWAADEEYVRFLIQICRHAGFKDTSLLKGKPFVRRVHTLSKGLTGETWKLMSRLIEYAETEGSGKLTPDMLDKIKWIMPGERRWLASQSTRQEANNGTDIRGDHVVTSDRAQEEDRDAKQETDAKLKQRNHRKPHRSDQSTRRSAAS